MIPVLLHLIASRIQYASIDPLSGGTANPDQLRSPESDTGGSERKYEVTNDSDVVASEDFQTQ